MLSILKYILLLMGTLLLAQCTQSTDMPLPSPKQPPLTSPYVLHASAYLALADQQTGREQQALYLMAAGRFLEDGQWHESLAILSRINDLPEALSNQKILLLAKIDLICEKPALVLAQLAAIHHLNQSPCYDQVQFHALLAEAYQAEGKAIESLTERIKLDKLLPDETSQVSNRRMLWFVLTSLPTAELDTLSLDVPHGSLLDGWVQLALIARKSYPQVTMMLSQLEQWEAKYPGHPGHSILVSPRSKITSTLFDPPKQMALLLPLSGPLAGPSSAIQDGFMAAASHDAGAVTIRSYNTDKADVSSLYQQALAEGAQYVVGPLTKAEVASVARMPHPVPTLLLNDVAQISDSRAYQFSLSPTYEARQVASQAHTNGYRHALVIGPAGEWGSDVMTAFSKQWRAHGGEIVDVLRYQTGDDLNTRMRDFLRVAPIDAHGKELKQLLAENIRRQDFDVVFLLAYPSKARQIVPLLKYYFAGNIPVYATSIVYAGYANAKQDKDLDGLIFCDTPWVFSGFTKHKNWPEQLNSYNRLYALGMDSYALAKQLNQLLLFSAIGIHDKRGVLYFTANRQIARVLTWSQFKRGIAQKRLSTSSYD